MRPQTDLRHTRTRVRSRYALLPLEGYPPSSLPFWTLTEARILASPALGAEFAQYLLAIQPQGGCRRRADGTTETFFYVLSGQVELTLDRGTAQLLSEGGFALVSPTNEFQMEATEESTVIMLRKRFEAVQGIKAPESLVGNQADVPAEIWQDIDGARLQTLIPDEMPYDMAMNIFTFEPGYSLPVVETHVMEHGLYFLQGKGLYYLDEEWMEVEAGDFIWMGPYVPQSFYATGPVASRYLYYKNVNRDILL
jgi:(S)-ureidoglycine aminohydrolase